jgi:tetratricopeptide (TPR) repeat protein
MRVCSCIKGINLGNKSHLRGSNLSEPFKSRVSHWAASMLLRKSLRPALRAMAAVLLVATIGCKPGVKEDRTITFSPDGKASFQHGKNGVFITDPATGKPKQIHKPAPDELAISPPIWDAGGKRMVFAVAKATDGIQREVGDTPADGRRFAELPVSYTCFLYDSSAPNGKPEKLFETTCGHVGYIGAGLGMQWHHDGKHLDYIEQSAPNQHHIRSFDLNTRKSGSVSLSPAEHIALGSSTNQSHRIALLGGAGEQSGLWIENTGTGTWWRVPDSASNKVNLEELRQRLPKWSRDGTKLAFADGPTLRVCDIATKQTQTWYQGLTKQQPEQSVDAALMLLDRPQLSDLYWHPDGKRIGLVDDAQLIMVGPSGLLKKVNDSSVVSFAGWSADEKRMAYVSTEPLPYSGAPWATLLVPNVHAHSAVWITDANGENPGKKLVTGVRATYLHWSQNEPKLSAWLTVVPPYHLPDEGYLGMRPGDPAAIIDPETGQLDWLPVNGSEQAQIAHVDLHAGRLDAAIRRFDEAAATLPPGAKADWMFFRAIALQKARRYDDANEAWKRFEPSSPPKDAPGAAGNMNPQIGDNGAIKLPTNSEVISLRHRFAAEAFISLDLSGEGIEYFQREVKEAKTDPERFSALVVLCQLYLLTDKRVEYVELATNQLLPLSRRILDNTKSNGDAINGAVASTILPLAVSEFSSSLNQELVRRVCGKISSHPQRNDDIDYVCQNIVRTLSRNLQDAGNAEKADKRLGNHPARLRWNLNNKESFDLEFLKQFRLTLMLPELLREMF